ncbi:uncharacterized protein LOC143100803 [Alosa pseudoharengus]|uniref:uncharacterized protein LOC143100803 n=1 Tax=Alosa pseudoharengus TaxID=34774 RepID=UPI003F89EF0B
MLCITTVWLHILENILDLEANLQKTKPITSMANKMSFMSAENERSSQKEYLHIKPFSTLHPEESFKGPKDFFSEEKSKIESKEQIIATVDRKPDKNYVMTLNLAELDIFNRTAPQNELYFNGGPSSPNVASAVQSNAFLEEEKKDITLLKPSRLQYQDRTEQSERKSITAKSVAINEERRRTCDDVEDSSKSFSEQQGASIASYRTGKDIESPSNISGTIWQDTESKEIWPYTDEEAHIYGCRTLGSIQKLDKEPGAIQQSFHISPMNQAVSPEAVFMCEEIGEPSDILLRYDETHSRRNEFYDTQDFGHELPEKASEYKEACKGQGQICHPSKTFARKEDFPVNIEVPAKDCMESTQTFESVEMKHLQRPIFSYVKEMEITCPKNVEFLTVKTKSTEETMSPLEPSIHGTLNTKIMPKSKEKSEKYSLKDESIESLETNINQTGPAEKYQILPQLGDRDTLENIQNQSNLSRQCSQILPKDLFELHSEQTEVNLVRTPQPKSTTLAKYQGQDLEKDELPMFSRETGSEPIKPDNLLGYNIGSSSKTNFPEQMSVRFKESSITRNEDNNSNRTPPATFPKTDQFGHVIYEKVVGRNQDTIEIAPEKDNHLTEQSPVKRRMLQTPETRELQANVRMTSKGHEVSPNTDSHLIKDTEKTKLSRKKESDIVETERLLFTVKKIMCPTMTQGNAISGDQLTKSIETFHESYSLRDKSPQSLETMTHEVENLPSRLSSSSGSSDKSSDQISNKQFQELNIEKIDIEGNVPKILTQKERGQEVTDILRKALKKTMKTVEGLPRVSAMDSQSQSQVKSIPDDREQIKSRNYNISLGSTTRDNLAKHVDSSGQIGPKVYQEAVSMTQGTDKTLPEFPGKRVSKGFSQKVYEESISPTNLEISDADRSVTTIKDQCFNKRSDVSEDKSISLVRQRHLIKEPVSPSKSQSCMTPGSRDIPLEELGNGLREKGITTQDGINAAKHDGSTKIYDFGPNIQSNSTNLERDRVDLRREAAAKQKETMLLGGTVDSHDKIEVEKTYSKVEPTLKYIPKSNVDQTLKYRLQKSTLSTQVLIMSETDNDSLKKCYYGEITPPAGESTRKELEHIHSPPEMATRLEDASPTKVSVTLEKKMKTSKHKMGAPEKEMGQRQAEIPPATYRIGIKMLSSWAVLLFRTLLKPQKKKKNTHFATHPTGHFLFFLLRASRNISHHSCLHLLVVTCTVISFTLHYCYCCN